jgi:hypothetical protein
VTGALLDILDVAEGLGGDHDVKGKGKRGRRRAQGRIPRGAG